LPQGRQGIVALRVEGHLGDDADAEPQSDIGLDHVGVDRGQHHVGPQSCRSKARSMRERPVKVAS
jgi:hypothetical protein